VSNEAHRYLLKSQGKRDKVSALKALALTEDIKLADVAEVYFGHYENSAAYFGNGKSAIALSIQRSVSADVIKTIDKVEGDKLVAVRQEFSGQAHTHVECDISSGAVLTIRPGTFGADESKSASGEVVDKSGDAGEVEVKRKFLEVVEAEAGDVDITQADILVSVGRGIGEEENIELAEELAEALGGVVSCSRPVVDAKWLDHSRQVGTSGKTVKPKVYIAVGISGAFQHVAGIKGNPFIVAINTNPKAPIFQVADVGVVEDCIEFLPVLTEKVQEMK